MTTERTILPPNATALERAVDLAAPHWDALADTVRPADGSEHHTAFLPWLAAEWGLADLARHFPTTQALIDAALPWLMQRATPAAVLRALGWVGFPLARLDADGSWLHIDLGRTASQAELIDIAHVVRASIPAHVSFYRVYFAWDLRAITLDAAPALDAGILDNESGAWVDMADGQPIKVSFGNLRAALLQRPAAAAIRQRATDQSRRPLHQGGLGTLDAQRLDDRLILPALGGGTTRRPRLVPAAPAPGTPLHRRVPTARGLCGARQVAAALRARSHTRATLAPRPQPLARGWWGNWDASTWARTPILSRLTTEST